MRTIDLALKDLRQILRDKKSTLFLLIMPIVFTAFMGFALSRGNSIEDARLPIGFVTDDASGILSKNLQALLTDSKTLRVVSLAGEASAQVRDGSVAAVLTVPAGFSEKTLASEPVKLTLIFDPANPGGQTAQQAVQAIVVRVLSVAQVGRLSAERVAAVQPFADESARQMVVSNAIEQASAAWRDPQLTVSIEKATAVKAASGKPSSFAQSSPGMIVMFAIFGLTTSAMVLVLERKTRTLQRMLTTNISRAEIIAGHLLAMFMVVFVQQVLLVGVGQFVFGVDYFRDPLAVLLVMVAVGLWAASLGLAIGALAKGEEQVILWSLIAMFVLSGLGGAWFPLESTGQTFAAIGHLLPSAWAMDGFQNIAVRGLALNSVALPVVILLGYAAAFFGLAVWRFRFE